MHALASLQIDSRFRQRSNAREALQCPLPTPARQAPGGMHKAAMATALLAVLLPFAATHAQQIYKSVDADGHVVYSNEPDPAATQVPLDFPVDGPSLPGALHMCWTNCFTLELNNGVYQRADGTPETWTVERFSPDAVVLHRHDAPAAWNRNRGDVTYRGVVVDEHLTNVTVDGRPVPAIDMAWGDALDSVPGSNAERDQRHWVPSPALAYTPSAPPPMDIGWDGVGEITATQAPPPLQYEDQPENVQDGYLWTPGYWVWVRERYFWLPGIWVRPPRYGVLWTPGYWGYSGGFYTFYPGYWGAHVGYYGGINYGYGYFGSGFSGGRWVGNTYTYNRSVSNVNTTGIGHTYSEPVATPGNAARVSFNGGPGGTTASPSAQERAAAAEAHLPPTSRQLQSWQRVAGPAPTRTPVHVTPSGGNVVAKTPAPGDRPVRQEHAAPQPVPQPAPRVTETHPSKPAGPALPAKAPETEAPRKVTEEKAVRERPRSH